MLANLSDLSERRYFECACDYPTHVLRTSYFKDEPDGLYVDCPMIDQLSFFKRLVLGVKYILGIRTNDAFYTEVLLSPTEVKNLMNHCNDFLKDAKNNSKNPTK